MADQPESRVYTGGGENGFKAWRGLKPRTTLYASGTHGLDVYNGNKATVKHDLAQTLEFCAINVPLMKVADKLMLYDLEIGPGFNFLKQDGVMSGA
jgi:hypothetical protein